MDPKVLYHISDWRWGLWAAVPRAQAMCFYLIAFMPWQTMRPNAPTKLTLSSEMIRPDENIQSLIKQKHLVKCNIINLVLVVGGGGVTLRKQKMLQLQPPRINWQKFGTFFYILTRYEIKSLAYWNKNAKTHSNFKGIRTFTRAMISITKHLDSQVLNWPSKLEVKLLQHPNKRHTLGLSFGPEAPWMSSIHEFIWRRKRSLLPNITDNEFRVLRQPQVNMAKYTGIL